MTLFGDLRFYEWWIYVPEKKMLCCVAIPGGKILYSIDMSEEIKEAEKSIDKEREEKENREKKEAC